MAKPNNTASNNTTASAPVAAAVAPASMASKQGTVLALPPSPTDVQQDANAFLEDFTSLVNVSEDADAPANSKATPDALPSRKAKTPATESDADDTATAATESDEDEDKPLLGEDDAEEDAAADDDAEADEDEDTEGADKAQKTLSKQLFKAREAKRQLKSQLEAAQTRTKELEEQVAKITTAPAAPRFDGFFADARTLDDLTAKESWLEQRAAQLEDNDDGFSEIDAATNEETDREPQWIKQQLRAVRAELKRLPTLRAAMETTLQRSQQSADKAKKVYPFVFDTSSKHHAMVLDLIKEHPELQTSPDRSLLLGRLALAKLVESKAYVLVPKGKAASAPPAASAAPAQARTAPVARPAASASPVSPARSQPDPLPRVLSSRSQDAEDWIRSVVGA